MSDVHWPGGLSKVRTECAERLAERARVTDEVLFEGRWLSIREAERRYRRLKWRSRLKLGELLVWFLFLTVAALVQFSILAILGGIAP